MTKLDLAAIDNQLLDGLEFCTRVYDLFDRARKQPDGIARLRLRPSNIEKRLIEELIPIARYLQARYREGRRIKVRWLSGSQSYDAVLWSSGAGHRRGAWFVHVRSVPFGRMFASTQRCGTWRSR
ncbi:MAG TPA: hypothetical protein VII34_01300 [Pyrinomonadaceae bacterium]